MVPGPHEMVGCRLARRVGRARIVARRLGEAPVRTEAAEDLVGAHMQEAEGLALGSAQAQQVVARRLEQNEGALDIGPDEIGRPVDRPVDMAFGGKVNHCVRPEATKTPR